MNDLFRSTPPHVRAFAPGRTELAGNHLDHQHGRVIAAALTDGITAEARANDSDLIRLESEGFGALAVDTTDLNPHESEHGRSAALVRGMAAAMSELGIEVRGFDAAVTTTLPSGGGLSSSAAFELALGHVMNTLFANGRLDGAALARMAQRTEVRFFGKPCGLMDQAVIAHGGIVAIDLADPESPRIEPIAFDFESAGYRLCLVDVGCDHSRFTDEYAQIPADMRRVANACGQLVLADVPEAVFLRNFDRLRRELGDRAVLRGWHFYRESRLTAQREQALRTGDIGEFLRCTRLSGASSAQYLQNVSCGGDYQPAMVALALAEGFLDDDGACRIHGGGFGGSIQAFVPTARADAFCLALQEHFGAGSCRLLETSDVGAGAVQL